MITTRRLMIVLAAVSLSLGAIAGCKGKEGEGGGNKDKRFAGKYYNRDDPQEYIDLKVDGRFFRRSRNSLGVASVAGEYTEETGKWQVDGNEIVFIGPVGDVKRAQIKDRAILADGKVWVGEAKPDELKDRVPGKYDMEFIVAGEVRKTDTYAVLTQNGSASAYTNGQLTDSGTWKIEGRLIQIYGQDHKKKLVDGHAYGNFIVFTPDDQGTTALFAKQVPGALSQKEVAEGTSSGGIDKIPDSEKTWVKCNKCGQSYEMGLKQYWKELEEKAKANPSPIPVAMPLTCQKCGQDAVRKAFKCEKCGEVFFVNSVQGDLEDRCPKCKYSAIEAKREAAKKARPGQ